jgi:hypothetical protein
MDYHLVSVPASGNRQNTFQNLKGKLAEFANTYSFPIPEFKVSMKSKELGAAQTTHARTHRYQTPRLVLLTPLFFYPMSW